MSISNVRVKELLEAIPGSRKAAVGIIIPFNGQELLPKEALRKEELEGRIMGEQFGSEFHLRNIFTKDVVEQLQPEEEFFLEICSLQEVYRLRELKGPIDYLLRLRANSITYNPRAVRLIYHRRQILEDSGRPWSLSYYYHQRDHFHKSYISMLKPAQKRSVKSIPAGLAYIPEVNALCIRSIAGDVIVVSESLEMFYYFMSIAFYGEHFGLNWTDKRDALIIAIRIIAGVETHDFELDNRGTLPLKADKGIKEYVDYQMKFTFGHEYSHYLLNHLDAAEVMECSLGSNSHGIENVAMYDHELEYQADYHALKNIMHNKDEFDEMAHGAFSALFFLHFIEECSSKIHIRKLSVSKTHPKAIDRIKQLHKRLGKKTPINESVIDEMLKSSDLMLHVVEQALSFRSDIFKFYGSVHLSNYIQKPLKDRIMY